MSADLSTDTTLRDLAVKQLKKRADFRVHLLIYLLVNAFLVGIWAVTGTGFFWPIFIILGWAIGLGANAWDVYFNTPPTESEIRKEMANLRAHS